MKKTVAALTLLAMTAAGVQTASAGDREWATVGKVLTGLVAAQVVTRAIDPGPVYETAYYAPAPVYVQPAPVYAPTPVVVAPPPVYYYARPASVYVTAPRVYVAPRPLVGVHFGYGGYYGHRHRYHCW